MGLKEKIKEDINNKSFSKNKDLLSYAKWVLSEMEKESDLKQEMLDMLIKIKNSGTFFFSALEFEFGVNGEELGKEIDSIIQKAKELDN